MFIISTIYCNCSDITDNEVSKTLIINLEEKAKATARIGLPEEQELILNIREMPKKRSKKTSITEEMQFFSKKCDRDEVYKLVSNAIKTVAGVVWDALLYQKMNDLPMQTLEAIAQFDECMKNTSKSSISAILSIGNDEYSDFKQLLKIVNNPGWKSEEKKKVHFGRELFKSNLDYHYQLTCTQSSPEDQACQEEEETKDLDTQIKAAAKTFLGILGKQSKGDLLEDVRV
jgi:hypothetical protein